MKYIGASFVLLVAAQLSTALFVPESHPLLARQNNKFGGNRVKGGNNNQNNGTNQNGGNNNTTTANNNQNNGNGGQGGDPQTSLTLDPSVIQKIDGTAVGAGESDSLVSTNNFINFCVGKTITNGLQVQAGSCNPTPMGDIPSVDNMPTCKFQFPTNGGNIDANTAFTVILNTQGMQTGDFTDAATTYFAAPQTLNAGGQIIGHNHVVIELLPSLDSTQPTNPRVFSFFKGLNDVAVKGQLTADVTAGLPAGTYRISSITTSANHQSAIVPVAQRGSIDDAIYFTVGGNGGNNTNGGNNGTTNGGNNNGTTTDGGNNGQTPPSNNGGNKKGGKQGGRKGRRYERRFFAWE